MTPWDIFWITTLFAYTILGTACAIEFSHLVRGDDSWGPVELLVLAVFVLAWPALFVAEWLGFFPDDPGEEGDLL